MVEGDLPGQASLHPLRPSIVLTGGQVFLWWIFGNLSEQGQAGKCQEYAKKA